MKHERTVDPENPPTRRPPKGSAESFVPQLLADYLHPVQGEPAIQTDPEPTESAFAKPGWFCKG